jgi:hypothetical protein
MYTHKSFPRVSKHVIQVIGSSRAVEALRVTVIVTKTISFGSSSFRAVSQVSKPESSRPVYSRLPYTYLYGNQTTWANLGKIPDIRSPSHSSQLHKQTTPKAQYLLLVSLKEVLASTQLTPSETKTILQVCCFWD